MEVLTKIQWRNRNFRRRHQGTQSGGLIYAVCKTRNYANASNTDILHLSPHHLKNKLCHPRQQRPL